MLKNYSHTPCNTVSSILLGGGIKSISDLQKEDFRYQIFVSKYQKSLPISLIDFQ